MEVYTIKEYLSKLEYQHWSITPVYFQMLRDKAAFFSRTTFYKYENPSQLQRAKPEKKRYNSGIRVEAPKKIMHMDVTIFKPLGNTKVYLYFLVDNFSRFIINWNASLKYSIGILFENLIGAYERYDLGKVQPGIDLVIDGGPENKG